MVMSNMAVSPSNKCPDHIPDLLSQTLPGFALCRLWWTVLIRPVVNIFQREFNIVLHFISYPTEFEIHYLDVMTLTFLAVFASTPVVCSISAIKVYRALCCHMCSSTCCLLSRGFLRQPADTLFFLVFFQFYILY